MKRFMPMKEQFRVPTGQMRIANANHHNLNNVTVDIPEGVLTVVTGVAGSGKSSLIHHAFLSQHPEAVVIDQSAVSTSIRSNPATYTGIMDDIRSLFAKANDQSPSLFSFNSKGPAPTATGLVSSIRTWRSWKASSLRATPVTAGALRMMYCSISSMEK